MKPTAAFHVVLHHHTFFKAAALVLQHDATQMPWQCLQATRYPAHCSLPPWQCSAWLILKENLPLQQLLQLTALAW